VLAHVFILIKLHTPLYIATLDSFYKRVLRTLLS